MALPEKGLYYVCHESLGDYTTKFVTLIGQCGDSTVSFSRVCQSMFATFWGTPVVCRLLVPQMLYRFS